MPDKYQKFAQDIAREAGDIIRENFVLSMKKRWKEDRTPVTETDTKINSLVIERVSQQFPDHSVLGEEESHTGNSDYWWVCDPLDGTTPFSHGIPACVFSLALVHQGKSVMGVIYDPFCDRLFYASQGRGAYLNDQPIKVSQDDSLTKTVGSYDYVASSKYNLQKLAEVLTTEKAVFLVRLVSSIYPACLVAAGELSFSLFPNDKAHDVAAVKIIVEEAEGLVTDLAGGNQRYDEEIKGAIASNGSVHDELVQLSKRLVPELD